ncbi:TnsD family Tn7-like transposition protein [Variovorax sp. HJSM1_2]|uniref:TnsD family Tn7-like transposition protein n=1 Tax=Variovorax sp. HJSM1_2 TaxID=3366263 RepID=UPI003BE01D96
MKPASSLQFAPALLPDELLYSWVGRAAMLNVLGPPRTLVKTLFGAEKLIPVVDLPTRLEPFHQRLGVFSPCGSIEELIDRGTLYPYHRPFIDPARHAQVMHSIFFGGGQGLKTLLGRVANRFGANPPLRYCHRCLLTDLEQWGCCFWHASHQLPGVRCCPVHGDVLTTGASTSSLPQRQRITLPPTADQKATLERATAQQMRFASLSKQLLEARLPAQDPWQLRAVYYRAFEQLGHTRSNNAIDFHELAAILRKHYADFDGFEHKRRLLSSESHPLCWLRTVFDRPGVATHPICHLVLIGFLFESIHDFRLACESTQIALAPWTRKEAPSSTIQPSGEATRPNESSDALQRKLLLDTTCSCRQVAISLGLSTTTVVLRRRALKIPIASRCKSLNESMRAAIKVDLQRGLTPAEVAVVHKVSPSSVYRLRSEIAPSLKSLQATRNVVSHRRYRSNWGHLLKLHGKEGVNAVRALDGSTYAWLYRHDHEWLLSTCQRFQRPSGKQNRVDWPARDRELSRKVLDYAVALKRDKNCSRLSRSRLLQSLGERMVRTHGAQLPQLMACLDALAESREMYQMRRISRCIEQIHQEGNALTWWRLQKVAGLKTWSPTLKAHAMQQAKRLLSLTLEV